MKTIDYEASGGKSTKMFGSSSETELVHIQAQDSAYATEWASPLSGRRATEQLIGLLGNISLGSKTSVYMEACGLFDYGGQEKPSYIVDLETAGEFLESTRTSTAFLYFEGDDQLMLWANRLDGYRVGLSGERGTLDFDFFDRLLEATGSAEVVSMKDNISCVVRDLLAGYEKL